MLALTQNRNLFCILKAHNDNKNSSIHFFFRLFHFSQRASQQIDFFQFLRSIADSSIYLATLISFFAGFITFSLVLFFLALRNGSISSFCSHRSCFISFVVCAQTTSIFTLSPCFLVFQDALYLVHIRFLFILVISIEKNYWLTRFLKKLKKAVIKRKLQSSYKMTVIYSIMGVSGSWKMDFRDPCS